MLWGPRSANDQVGFQSEVSCTYYVIITSSFVDVVSTVANHLITCRCHIHNQLPRHHLWMSYSQSPTTSSFVDSICTTSYYVITCGCHIHSHLLRHHLWMSYSQPPTTSSLVDVTFTAAYLCLYNMENHWVLYKSAMRAACLVTVKHPAGPAVGAAGAAAAAAAAAGATERAGMRRVAGLHHRRVCRLDLERSSHL